MTRLALRQLQVFERLPTSESPAGLEHLQAAQSCSLSLVGSARQHELELALGLFGAS